MGTATIGSSGKIKVTGVTLMRVTAASQVSTIASNTADVPASSFGELFLAMAEELKLPLQHIARQAELHTMQIVAAHTKNMAGTSGIDTIANSLDTQTCLQGIITSADMSLQLLDSYLLSLRLSLEPSVKLALEPVSVSSVLYDTANQLQDIAKQYGVTLNLHVHGRYEPVMAHRQALQAALLSLGYALIEALPATGMDSGKRYVQLATHRTKHGIVAGLYGELDALTPELFQRAKQLQGRARQPLVGTMSGSGAGVFIADSLLGAMESRLRVGRFQRLPGFAVTLAASEQLQLV